MDHTLNNLRALKELADKYPFHSVTPTNGVSTSIASLQGWLNRRINERIAETPVADPIFSYCCLHPGCKTIHDNPTSFRCAKHTPTYDHITDFTQVADQVRVDQFQAWLTDKTVITYYSTWHCTTCQHQWWGPQGSQCHKCADRKALITLLLNEMVEPVLNITVQSATGCECKACLNSKSDRQMISQMWPTIHPAPNEFADTFFNLAQVGETLP